MPFTELNAMPELTPSRPCIGADDAVSLRGRYLVKADGSRFVMKGIGFPVPEPGPENEGGLAPRTFNATAWNGILHQLRGSNLELEINTVRVYRMDPSTDYSAFFDEAARLGIYVIVPLTAAEGKGVLDRNKRAPKCYSRHLFQYGVKCLENYLRYPNTVAGLIGNEVMNSLETWPAAPCVKAYARDLKLYMEDALDRPLPLMYAAQHSGFGPSLDDVSAMRLTMDYLTCVSEVHPGQGGVSGMAAMIHARNVNELAIGASIDVFGINVESWCSSEGTFEQNEDGSEGSYFSLWKGLHNSTIPLVLSEMGCSHLDFDRDNGLQKEGGPRDWKQVPVVLNQMNDVFSGFCAYAYSGNPLFDMFEGGPWKNEPLDPTRDFFNFRDELRAVTGGSNDTALLTATSTFNQPPSCGNVEAELHSHLSIKLYDVNKMKSYSTARTRMFWPLLVTAVFAAIVVVVVIVVRWWQKKMKSRRLVEQGKLLETREVVTYKSMTH